MFLRIFKFLTKRRWVVVRKKYGGLRCVTISLKLRFKTICSYDLWKYNVTHDDILTIKNFLIEELKKESEIDNSATQNSICVAESVFIED